MLLRMGLLLLLGPNVITDGTFITLVPSTMGSGDAEGHARVGFGPFFCSSITRKGLFESVDQNHKSYVQELLHHPVTHPGGQLDKIKQYLIRRQQEQEKK